MAAITERQRITDAAKARGWTVMDSGPHDLILSKGDNVIIVGCNPDRTVKMAMLNEKVLARGDRSKMAKITAAIRSL